VERVDDDGINIFSTTGTVKDDKGNVLKGVKIKLLEPGGTVVKTTTTNKNGFYEFLRDEPCGLPAHNYNTVRYRMRRR
jgi:Carboxypeptidase regulatory-like domain